MGEDSHHLCPDPQFIKITQKKHVGKADSALNLLAPGSRTRGNEIEQNRPVGKEMTW
jgi:hypothetical protein